MYKPIYTWKLRRYFDIKNFFEVFGLLIGVIQSLIIIFKFRPNIIFCKGGFVSIPVAIAGFITRTKIIAHESDTIPGLSNKIISLFANKICTGFDIKGKKYIFTGNPLRRAIKTGDQKKGYKMINHRQNKIILVIGGSQGSKMINDNISNIAPLLVKKYFIIHITGKNKKTDYTHKLYKQFEYIDNNTLAHIYKIIDIAITRGGANVLTELMFNNIPMVIIPLENSANNHQYYNAKHIETNGLGICIKEKEISPNKLKNSIDILLNKKEKKINYTIKTDGAREIAKIIISYL